MILVYLYKFCFMRKVGLSQKKGTKLETKIKKGLGTEVLKESLVQPILNK